MGTLQFKRYGFGLEITSDVSKKQARCVACNLMIPKHNRRVVMKSHLAVWPKYINGTLYRFKPKIFFHEQCYMSPLESKSCPDCGCVLPEHSRAVLCMPCHLSDRYRLCMSCHETVRRRDSKAVEQGFYCKKCIPREFMQELEYQSRYDEIMRDLVLKDEFI